MKSGSPGDLGGLPLDAVDVILRDGRTLRLRSPQASDRDDLTAFLERLSAESMSSRFHAALRPRAALIDAYLDAGWDERGALIGELTGEGVSRVVALGSYDRLRDPQAAEVALAVADDLQGVGIGTQLLEQLARRAAAHEISHLVLEVQTGNARMLRLVRDCGYPVETTARRGVVEMTVAIEGARAGLARRDERHHVGIVASLAGFLAPESVAVYGASARRGTIGGELFHNLREGGFAGRLFPVNRSGAAVAGAAGVHTLANVEPPVDLAVICVPAAAVLGAARDALESGVRALCVVSAGFAEAGADGAERQAELLSAVRAHGARLIGPNCLGVFSASRRLNATFSAQPPPAGSVGFASQSGALGLAVVEQARGRRLGLSAFVSLGNKADVSSNDLLEYWEDDPATNVIALYLESFGNPARFARIARRVARTKPVIALKGGSTPAGARAAASHTAALTSSDAAVDALFHQAGVMRARNLSEFIDASLLLSAQPLPHGRRVAAVTNGGGLGILFADACAAEGLELPEPSPETVERLRGLTPAEASLHNPVDLLGSATAATFGAVLPLLVDDPAFDAVCVLFVRPVVATAADVERAVDAAAAASTHTKPIVAVMLSSEAPRTVEPLRSVTSFASPEAAARALGIAARRADWLRRPQGIAPALPDVDRAAARAVIAQAAERGDEVWLDADESRRLLAAYRIPLAVGTVAETPDEAVAAAAAIAGPVAVKSALPGAHKTETGGVVLGVQGATQVRAAAAGIGGAVLVQPMLEGEELLAGIVQDPVFGPLVILGIGGTRAELFGQVSLGLAPLTDQDAEDLITRGAVGRLAAGFRGRPPLDRSALLDLLLRLSALADECPQVAELDLNPVLASSSGCVAVDQRIRVRRHVPAARLKSW